ncbi:hypothetical protein YTPLAS73_11420 [Nitrosarchaeum sp.]|nr:hypothetical protein YTPLAS73_11420 [Nitrosarchaeum sp.]
MKNIPASTEVKTVITNNIENSKSFSGFGYAKIGQVYGLSNIVLNQIVKQILVYYETGKIDDFKITVSELDCTKPIIDTVFTSEINS